MWKAVAVTLFGLLLGTVGLDPVRSAARFTFGSLTLQSGIDLVPMVMGLFGISEVFHLMESKITSSSNKPVDVPKGLIAVLPTRQDWRDARRAIAQGSLVGFLVGLLPGGGATISSYVAHAAASARSPRRSSATGYRRRRCPRICGERCNLQWVYSTLNIGTPDNVVMALIWAHSCSTA
jgi:putative tricarboxylic transport membrane protein